MKIVLGIATGLISGIVIGAAGMAAVIIAGRDIREILYEFGNAYDHCS